MEKNIAMLFPGQGSQSVGMGLSFYEHFELARDMFEQAKKRVNIDFKQLFEGDERLSQTAYTQPAILLVSIIAYKLFEQETTIKPVYFLGHSLGEFSALCATGAIDFLDALELVHERGKLMQEACSKIDAGMMAIIGLDDERVMDVCSTLQNNDKKIWAANFNQNGQVVVAGLKQDLIEAQDLFKENGAKKTILLDMSVASHCDLLQPAQEPLKNMMTPMIINNFIAPVISNVTATEYHTSDDAINLLTQQLIKPVKYKQSIENIAKNVDLFIEFGNNSVLKGLNRRIAKSIPTLNIFDANSLNDTVDTIKA